MRGSILIVLALSGCLRDTSYKCSSDQQCGAGGVCEMSVGGYCSFADSSCSSGRKFGTQAGSYANTCVGGMMGSGVDSGVTDMAMGSGSDAPPGTDAARCPSDFAKLNGAPQTRYYKLIATADTWLNQKNACSGMGTNTYLAYPETSAETTALDTLAGTHPAFFIGIDDLLVANSWVNVKGGAAMYNATANLPWAGGQPNTGGSRDCVVNDTASGLWSADTCGGGGSPATFPAICACE